MPVTIVPYKTLEGLTPLDAANEILKLPKFPFEDMLVGDIFEPAILRAGFVDQYYRHVFKRGTYLFFDKNDVRYIGKAKDGFYPRLMGHITTEYRPGIGFNAALVYISIDRGVPADQLSTAELETSMTILRKYNVVLIDIEYNLNKEVDVNNHIPGKLETILKKAFKQLPQSRLLNSKVGNISEWEQLTSISEIVRL